MKKLLPLLIALLALSACEKDPDLDKLSTQNLIYVDYNESFNKADYSTFWVRDTIRVIISQDSVVYLKEKNSELYNAIMNAFISNMEGQGYTQASSKEDADLGVQIAYTAASYRVTDYYSPYDNWYSPWNYWYGGYGYWGSYYPGWGGWGPYGSAWTYTYSTGSIIASIIELGSTAMTVEWVATIHNLVGTSGYPSAATATNGINIVFGMKPFSK